MHFPPTRLDQLFAFAFSLLVIATPAYADARAEVDAAYAKLAASSGYRKREIVLGPMSAFGGGPIVTAHAHGLTRQVFEYTAPQFGRIRTERVTLGRRAAVRTEAPEILALIERTKAKATASSARSVLQQIVSLVAAAHTGGLAATDAIQGIVTSAATIKGAADARRALDQAAAAFNSWQLVREDEDDAMMMFDPAAFPMEIIAVGNVTEKDGSLRKYLRRPAGAMAMAGAPAVEEALFIDPATGLPVAEETFVGGQRMMRVEYFDVGAAITIALPDCLR